MRLCLLRLRLLRFRLGALRGDRRSGGLLHERRLGRSHGHFARRCLRAGCTVALTLSDCAPRLRRLILESGHELLRYKWCLEMY